MEKEFASHKAVIYAISNEAGDKLKQMREAHKLGSSFVFLSDPDAKLASLYAGKYDKGFLKPATIVVGKGGKIAFATSLDDYSVRPAARAVLEAVSQFDLK